MSKGTVNKAIIVGRLGADPEVRNTPNGQTVANFTLATNSSFKSGDEWKEKTEWHNVVAWGQKAEFAGNYLKKGARVYVEGRIETRSWEDQEGQKRYKTEIVAHDLQSLSDKPGSGEQVSDNGSAPVSAMNVPDDSIPF